MNKVDKKVKEYLDRATKLYSEGHHDFDSIDFDFVSDDVLGDEEIVIVGIAKMIQQEELCKK